MDPVPDPLLLRKSGSAGNRTRDLCICSQKLWPLDHRGGPLMIIPRWILLRMRNILLKNVIEEIKTLFFCSKNWTEGRCAEKSVRHIRTQHFSARLREGQLLLAAFQREFHSPEPTFIYLHLLLLHRTAFQQLFRRQQNKLGGILHAEPLQLVLKCNWEGWSFNRTNPPPPQHGLHAR